MSKLEQLISELCPNGVDYVHLWEVTVWDKRFNSVDRKKQKQIITYPYLLASNLFNLEQPTGNVFLLSTGEKTGWTNEKLAGNYLRQGEVVAIPWGKSRPLKEVIKYYKGKFVTADNRIATSNDTDKLLNKYLYYCMINQGETIDKFYRGSGIKHPNMNDVLNVVIPLPPLPVQEEIVRILDKFTELTAELTARKQQYEYYRDDLLSKNTNKKSLKQIALSSRSGGTPLKSNKDYYENGTIPWLRTQEVVFNEINKTDCFITELAVQETSAKWIPANCLIVAISGASAGRCAINKIPLTTNQHCLAIEINPEVALYKYVFYCVCNQYDDLIAKKEGARGDLNSSRILGLEIPIPYPEDKEKSLAEQQRIVDMLDRFDRLCNNISEGLPAEIEVRQKQYEYYRDKLLTFKKKEEAENE